ncbi:MAG: MFS transporter [Deltaproteobacteria bacterium]|nr:MFS transporter [Deltaproteobacteria bacterium]
MKNEEDNSHNTVRNILTRDFVLGFLALFVFIVAYHSLIPTLPIFFKRLGSSEGEIGILIGIFGASSLIFRLIVGSILLKYPEKYVMMFGSMLFAFTFIASIALRPFWPFFAVRFFQGVAFAFIDTAALAFIVKVVPLANRGRAISYFVLAPPFSQAIAPSFGMFIINRYDFTVLFLICLALSLCALFFSWKVKGQQVVASHRNTSTNNSLFLDVKIIAPSVMNFLQNFAWGGIIAFIPLYAINCGITNPGYFFTANATMLIMGRVLGGRILDAYSKEKLIRTFIFTSVIAMVLLSFSKTLPMLIVVGILWGTGGSFFFPATMAYALDYAGSSGGTSVGTFRAFSDLGLAIGPVLTGAIIPFTGYQGMFLCLAFIGLINLCYFHFYLSKKGV